MTNHNQDRRELELLLGALRENTLSADQADRLRARLRDDQEARRELVEHMMLVAALREADIPLDIPATIRPRSRPPARRRSLMRWALAAAATVLIAVGAAGWFAHQGQPVGRLLRQEACQWSAGQLPLSDGDTLRRGSLCLDSGLIELRLGRGANMVLEGPARLDLESDNRCFLHFGRAVVRIEEEARGFILDGPDGRIVDLGTEFGVSVGQTGGMEVHVLEGRVTAQPTGLKKPVELGQREALQWSAQEIQRLAAQPLSFVTDLPIRTNRPIGYLHWSFDEGSGIVSKNLGRGLGEGDIDAHLRRAAPSGMEPEWTSGQFGSGIRFQGNLGFVECGFAGISGGKSRTIAFWVKVPTDITRDESYGIVSWGTYLPGMAWQISVNHHEEDGPTGPLRAGILKGAVVGSTDLRDDRWHHVAVVMYGGRRPDISTHVLLYVDGRLEQTISKAVCEVRTETHHEASRCVRLGRSIDSLDPPESAQRGYFRGCLDEVYIFDAPLTQAQIASLMWHNRLPENKEDARPLGRK